MTCPSLSDTFTTTHYGTFFCGMAVPWKCCKKQCLEEEALEEHVIGIFTNDLSSSLPYCTTVEMAQKVFQEAASSLQTLHFFPVQSSLLCQLIYYTNLSSTQSLFSQSENIILQRSAIAEKQTKRWLRAALIIGVIGITTLSWGLQLKAAWFEERGCGYIPIASNLLLPIISGSFAWVATGSNPDFKSDAANDRQDLLNQFPERIMELAQELLDLYDKNPQLAKYISQKISIPTLQKALLRDDPKSHSYHPDIQLETPLNLIALEAACNYILQKKIPTKAPLALKNYLKLRMLPV